MLKCQELRLASTEHESASVKKHFQDLRNNSGVMGTQGGAVQKHASECVGDSK